MCVTPNQDDNPKGEKRSPGAHSAHFRLVCVTSLVLSAQVRSKAQRSRATLLRSHGTRSLFAAVRIMSAQTGTTAAPWGLIFPLQILGGHLLNCRKGCVESVYSVKICKYCQSEVVCFCFPFWRRRQVVKRPHHTTAHTQTVWPGSEGQASSWGLALRVENHSSLHQHFPACARITQPAAQGG